MSLGVPGAGVDALLPSFGVDIRTWQRTEQELICSTSADGLEIFVECRRRVDQICWTKKVIYQYLSNFDKFPLRSVACFLLT